MPRLRPGRERGQLCPLRRLCEKLEGFLGFAPEARTLLDSIRAELMA